MGVIHKQSCLQARQSDFVLLYRLIVLGVVLRVDLPVATLHRFVYL